MTDGKICPCCEKLKTGILPVCGVCFAISHAVYHAKTMEEAIEVVKMMWKYPTPESCLLKNNGGIK